MATSMEDSVAQKILKALDEHGKAPKKMGGCLDRLEESKLKKSHMWKSKMTRMKWRNRTKETKQNMKETSNLRSSLWKA